MSVLRPVGPLPARAYWLRRGLALVLVVIVLFLASWAWGAVTGGSTGDDSAAGGAPGSSASPTVSPTQSAEPSASPSPSASPTNSPKPSGSPSGATTPACADADITVVATPSKTSYPASVDPRFTIQVVNGSKQPCKRDVGQKAMELRVSQSDTLVWSSDHCAPGGSANVVTLKAGGSFTTSVVWSRTTSKRGCPTDEPDAAPGTYALTGRNLTVTSKPAAFALD